MQVRRGPWSPLLQAGWRLGWTAFQVFSAWDAQRRARDDERRKYGADALRSRVEAAYLADPGVSGKLGRAALGTVTDARHAGLVNQGKGLPLGFLGGLSLSYLGDSHLSTTARTGGGKFRDVLAPVLATVKHESLIVVDPKDCSTTWATLEHRANVLKQKILVLNPHGKLQLPSLGLNVADRVVKKVATCDGPLEAARDLAEMLVPIEPGLKEMWPKQGAQQAILIWLVYLAYTKPASCNLPNLFLSLVRDESAIIKDLLENVATSSAPSGIPQQAASLAATLKSAKGQWTAIKQEIENALLFVAPGEGYAEAMRRTDFDVSLLKREPCTLYLIIDGRKIGTAGQYLQLIIDYLMETIAECDGPVRTTFLLDEFLQIEPLSRLPKTLNMYRSRGVRLWFFIHSWQTLSQRYTPEFASALDQGCDACQYWDLEDEKLIQKLEYLSGKVTVALKSVNTGASTVGSAGWAIGEHARPLLQADQIRLLGRGKQLLRVTGAPFFIAERVPYFEIDEIADALRDPRTVTSTSVLPLPATLVRPSHPTTGEN